jgi:hypothetical protein
MSGGMRVVFDVKPIIEKHPIIEATVVADRAVGVLEVTLDLA